MSEKKLLRSQVRLALDRLPENTKLAASAALRTSLEALPVFRQATVLAVFHPTAIEPDILPLLRHSAKTFLFPLCHPDKSLTWHRPNHRPVWRTSQFGICEPDPVKDPPVSPSSLDLVLVPGLAFTAEGNRLGHGAGFYDRFLATLPAGIPTIGLCFECQIFPALPTEPHDIRVGQVLYA